MERRIANIVIKQNPKQKDFWAAYVERFDIKNNGSIKRYAVTENEIFRSKEDAWERLLPFIERLDFKLYKVGFNGQEIENKERAFELGESIGLDFRFDVKK